MTSIYFQDKYMRIRIDTQENAYQVRYWFPKIEAETDEEIEHFNSYDDAVVRAREILWRHLDLMKE